MAKDYKFALYCWQDQHGDENAKLNVFVDGTQVATEVEITATSEASLQVVTFEGKGLSNPGSGVTTDIKLVLTNEAYVDADNDRNIWFNGLYATYKATGEAEYKIRPDIPEPDGVTFAGGAGNGYADAPALTDEKIADKSAFDYSGFPLATNVQGSQIDANWWANDVIPSGTWYHTPVWGDASDVGTTVTIPLSI